MGPKRVRHITRRQLSSRLEGWHRQLIVLTGALLTIGVLMVYSASAVIASNEGSSTFHYMVLQIFWVGCGIIIAYIAATIPLKSISLASVPIMVVSIVLLVAVLIVGKSTNSATRWIDLGPFDLQPSEVAKLGFTIYLSAWLAKARPQIKRWEDAIKHHFYQDLLPFMVLLGMVCILIVLQPDLDTAIIIAATALTVYFVSGKDAIHTLGTIFIVGTTVLVAVVAAVAAPYRLSRVQTYIDFLVTGEVQDKLDSGFQVWNSLVAVGSGGLFGVGYGESRQKLYYLQKAAFTDSIYPVIAEEFGLVGSVVIIGSFLYFLALGIDIAKHAADRFSALLAIGITTWIVLQAFLNIGANLALFPFGGIPLPFISYGGSHTLVAMLGVGLLLNVARHGRAQKSLS